LAPTLGYVEAHSPFSLASEESKNATDVMDSRDELLLRAGDEKGNKTWLLRAGGDPDFLDVY
jgi:hypothetical protein